MVTIDRVNSTNPTYWFKGKALENARHRIATGWDLFTAKPHDPYFYPTLPSANSCGWHNGTCKAEPVWAVMIPLKSATRISTCSLGTLEIVNHFRERSGDPELDLNFIDGHPDESSEIIARSIVELYDHQDWGWRRISRLFGIGDQRVRRLYDYVQGVGAAEETTGSTTRKYGKSAGKIA